MEDEEEVRDEGGGRVEEAGKGGWWERAIGRVLECLGDGEWDGVCSLLLPLLPGVLSRVGGAPSLTRSLPYEERGGN